MDLTWITERIALGGGIWNDGRMIELVRMDVTHIIDLQIEFDDRPLAAPYGVQVLWNPLEDDFQPKPVEAFRAGVEFAREALTVADSKLYIHCAAGIHRAPMMTLAVVCDVLGWEMQAAMNTIQRLRPVVDFADVYVESVREFLAASAARDAREISGPRRSRP